MDDYGGIHQQVTNFNNMAGGPVGIGGSLISFINQVRFLSVATNNNNTQQSGGKVSHQSHKLT